MSDEITGAAVGLGEFVPNIYGFVDELCNRIIMCNQFPGPEQETYCAFCLEKGGDHFQGCVVNKASKYIELTKARIV